MIQAALAGFTSLLSLFSMRTVTSTVAGKIDLVSGVGAAHIPVEVSLKNSAGHQLVTAPRLIALSIDYLLQETMSLRRTGATRPTCMSQIRAHSQRRRIEEHLKDN
jgi:hypothetical protein